MYYCLGCNLESTNVENVKGYMNDQHVRILSSLMSF